MNNKSGSESKPSPSLCRECGYDSIEIAHLQKLCEEQGRTIDILREGGTAASQEATRLTKLVEEQKGEISNLKHIMECANTPLMRDVMNERDRLKSQLADQTAMHDHYMKLSAERFDEIEKLKVQLATQTERARRLEEACKAMLKCHDADTLAGTNGGVSPESAELARQAVNQESLGDGK